MFLRQPRPEVPEVELRVDGRPVETLRELRDEIGDRATHDGDAERDRRIRLRDERPFDRLVDHGGCAEDVGCDEHEGRADREPERLLKLLLDRGRRRLRRQPADVDSRDRDADRNRRRGIRNRGGGRDQQSGDEEEDETLHVFSAAKIRGSLVMIPSTPARPSRSASAGSSTVQT